MGAADLRRDEEKSGLEGASQFRLIGQFTTSHRHNLHCITNTTLQHFPTSATAFKHEYVNSKLDKRHCIQKIIYHNKTSRRARYHWIDSDYSSMEGNSLRVTGLIFNRQYLDNHSTKQTLLYSANHQYFRTYKKKKYIIVQEKKLLLQYSVVNIVRTSFLIIQLGMVTFWVEWRHFLVMLGKVTSFSLGQGRYSYVIFW